MAPLKLNIRLNAEPLLLKLFDFTERLIHLKFLHAPILHLELADDGKSQIATVVYMHAIRREREGWQCRFNIVAYAHKPTDKPPRGPVRAYIMEYPLIKPSRHAQAWEYTVPILEHPWAN